MHQPLNTDATARVVRVLLLVLSALAVVLFAINSIPAAQAAPARQEAAGNQVLIVVEPETVTVTQGDVFTVTIEVQAGNQQVDGAAAYLNFDPNVLRVEAITPGTALPTVLENGYDNEAGTINYSAGTFSNFPSGTFTLMQVRFKALATSSGSFLLFGFEDPRRTDVTFDGASILTGHRDGRVVVQEEGSSNEVLIVVEPITSTVAQGEIFTVTIEVQAGNQQVDGAAAYLNFDPNVLKVKEPAITPGTALPTVLENGYDNEAGTINYSAGTFSNFPSGTFTLMQVQFEALAASSTELTFQFESPRRTDVTFKGLSLLTGHRNGTVVVQAPTVIALESFAGAPTAAGAHLVWPAGTLSVTLLLGGASYLLRRRRRKP